MAKITDYPSITNIDANTILLADGSSGTGKILASDMAKYALETYAGSTLAGSSQSVKDAFGALNSDLKTAFNTLLVREFNEANSYDAGQYVSHDGTLYRITSPHTPNVSWESTSKIATRIDLELRANLLQLAPVFNASSDYSVGQYVTYNNTVHRFVKNHAAGAWNNAEVVAVKIGDELTKTNSAIQNDVVYSSNNEYKILNARIDTSTNKMVSSASNRIVAIPLANSRVDYQVFLHHGYVGKYFGYAFTNKLEYGASIVNANLLTSNKYKEFENPLTVTIPAGYDYMLIYFYNTGDHAITESMFLDTLYITKKEDVEEHVVKKADLKESFFIGSIDSTEKIVESDDHYTLYCRVTPGKWYTLKRGNSSACTIGFTDSWPAINSVVYGYEVTSKETINVLAPVDCTFCCVTFYSGSFDAVKDAYNSFVVQEGINTAGTTMIDDVASDSIPLEAIAGINATREKSAKYVEYYAPVKEPSKTTYSNYPTQIKVNFEKGECRSISNIVVLLNDVSVPFQFEEARRHNYQYDTNESYWNDGSIKAGTIWVRTSLAIGETVTYVVRVYKELNAKSDFSKLVSFRKNKTSGEIEIKTPNETLTFEGTSYASPRQVSLSMSGVVDTNFKSEDYYIQNGTTIYIRDIPNPTFKIEGDGTLYLDVIYAYSTEDFNYELKYRIFPRIIVVSRKIYIKRTMSGVTDMIMKQFLGNASDLNVLTFGGTGATFTYNSLPSTASIIYANGNLARSDPEQSIPVFKPVSAVHYSGSDKINRIFAGWQNSTAVDIPKDFVFSSKAIIQFNAPSSQYIRHFNPLVTFATKETAEKSLAKIKNVLNHHALHISKIIMEQYHVSNGGMYLWADYYMYRRGKYTLDQVANAYDSRNTTQNLKDSAGLYTGFMNASPGMEFMGRYFPLSYVYYKEYTKLGETNKANVFKEHLKEISDFVVRVFNENNDIPLYGGHDPNNNARASALHLLALHLDIEEDSAASECYTKLSNVIDANSVLGTMLPEGDITKSRYTHYMSYALIEYLFAIKLVPTNSTVFYDYTNFIMDAVEPTGEIKDMVFNPSTARRGAGSTYAYFIASFVLSERYECIAMALNMLKWLVKQDRPDNVSIFPLDGYVSGYAALQNPSVIVFELPPYIQMLDKDD